MNETDKHEILTAVTGVATQLGTQLSTVEARLGARLSAVETHLTTMRRILDAVANETLSPGEVRALGLTNHTADADAPYIAPPISAHPSAPPR